MAEDREYANAVSREFDGLSLNRSNELLEPPQPPEPNLATPGVAAVDVTERFISAAKSLEPGELVKDGYFTLFESVGAPEIMDPKMDSGFLAPGESLDEEYDVSRKLLPVEVLGIIDQLLSLEMAWHLGHPLAQTLFTNVYLEAILVPAPETVDDADYMREVKSQEPKSPAHVVLRAYCLGLLKTCWYVVERVKFEQYYEEEDFATNTCHRSLLDKIDREKIRDTIQDARATIHSLRHTFSADMALALDARLELRYAFLRAIELAELRSHPEPQKTPWLQMKAILENIKKTHSLGTPVPDCFSTKLQRRIASTMPPRPIVELSFEDAYPHWLRLCDDGMEVNNVLKYIDSQTLLNFVFAFQAKKPQPLTYIRTLLQSYIFKDNILLGSLSIRHVMDDDFAIVVLPCDIRLDANNDLIEAVSDRRFAVAHQMEIFRQRAAQPYLDIFRAFCQNRCRLRRVLCHAVQEWENVQVDAEEIDQLLEVQLDERPLAWGDPLTTPDPVYPLQLSSWAYLYKLRMMEWIVQLGFELQVYQPDELAGMYWYLAYLAKRRASHVERIKSFTVQSLAARRSELESRSQPLSAAHEAQFARSLSFLRTAMLDAAVTWELADALAAVYTVLGRARLLRPPPRPYGSDALRYAVRMAPFAAVGLPELPAWDEFAARVARPREAAGEVLREAARAAAGARRGLEVLSKMGPKEAFAAFSHARWVGGCKDGLKSAISVGIVVSALQRALGEATGGEEGEDLGETLGLKFTVEVPPPEKGYHEWWIVPKITSIP